MFMPPTLFGPQRPELLFVEEITAAGRNASLLAADISDESVTAAMIAEVIQ